MGKLNIGNKGTRDSKGVKEVKQEVKIADSILGSNDRDTKPEEHKLVRLEDYPEDEPVVELLTEDYVKSIYPVKVRDTTIEKVTEAINESIMGLNGKVQEYFKDNLITYIDVLKEGGYYTLKKYLEAIKFVTLKELGNNNYQAYIKVFPEEFNRFIGKPEKDLYTMASYYSRSKIVTSIYAMMMIPNHIMYRENFHLAVKTQTEIMLDDSVSPKVRSDAANSLMTHLKAPETKQLELQVSAKDDSINSLAEALNALSSKQREMMIEGKYSSRELREATIIEVDPDE